MIATSLTMRRLSGRSIDKPTRRVASPDRLREDRIRRTARMAYLRLAGTTTEQGAALGVKHNTVADRRAGRGSFASVLLDVDALERAGIDTGSFAEALIEVQLGARAVREGRLDVRALSKAEQRIDGEEDVAQLAFHDGDPGARETWAQRLVASITAQSRLLFALHHESR